MLRLEVSAQLHVAQVAVVGQPRVVGGGDGDQLSHRPGPRSGDAPTPTTSPTTMTAGGATPSRARSAPRAPSVTTPPAPRASCPPTITATGVAPGPAARRSARRRWPRAFSTAISSTSVPRSARQRPPRHQGVGMTGREVAADHRELVGDAAVGHRDADPGRHGDRRGESRHDADRDSGLATGQQLLETAAEHEGSPPLNRTTRLPARARSTSSRLISSCCAARPARQLGDVDQLDVRTAARRAAPAVPADPRRPRPPTPAHAGPRR